MSLVKEFKDFALKGNVVDMAVGLVIGVAFKDIVSSLVANIITPFVSLFTGGVKFDKLAIVLKDAQGDVPALLLSYGDFFQKIFDFVIIALVIFIIVKAMNSMRKKEEAAPVAPLEPSTEEKLLTEIRDLLKR
jgi:large conductance mechanosensitive channel